MWIGRFNKDGGDGLFRIVPNAQRGKLTKEQIDALKTHLMKPPTEFGFDALAWTAKLVWNYIEKFYKQALPDALKKNENLRVKG